MLNDYLALGDTKIEIRHVEGEHSFAQEAFALLSKKIPSITSYFRVSGAFPKVRVVLVPNRNEFDRLVRDLLRIEIEAPSNPARIAQPQRTDMVVLSPSAYASHSIYKYVPDEFRRLLVHELVHMVEEYLSPCMEATPRWWSEGLAIYLSDQWLYEDEFRKPVLEGISQNEIPGIREIADDRKSAYEWGWTIVRFIESTYGKEKVLQIVRECADGDVFSVIGEGADSLQDRWRHWLIGEGRLTNQSSGHEPRTHTGDL